MCGNKVTICGVDTSKLPLMKDAQIKSLLKLSNGGDKKAREQIITGNLRLVLSVVKRFIGRGENPDDLFQIGCIGLIKSIDNFDVKQNVRFSTYAVPMVIECRNQRKDFDYYDKKNRTKKGNLTIIRTDRKRRDLHQTKRHIRGYAA